ncbi:hypothetical protein B6F22_13600 [Mycobacterium tuberculosis variant bovis]|nr:hypothetical protein B6F22_13600 [Mycobacterium tuberculosis variant bovis]
MTEALIPAPSQISLTRDEVRRYSRHLIIPDIGVNGQQRLKDARVLCIGAGGLGSPALLYRTRIRPCRLTQKRSSWSSWLGSQTSCTSTMARNTE